MANNQLPPCTFTVASGAEELGGLERSLAMFLFFVIPAVSFLFACTFAFTIT